MPPTSDLEIAHVLFMDIVGYSRRAMAEQTQALAELQELVRATPEFKRTEASGELICLPNGGGMALVFFRDPVAPVQCARQIAKALTPSPSPTGRGERGEGLHLRMGIHTGPLYRVEDINLNLNVSGGGINLAKRVMDCGDAGHILVSRAYADLLKQIGAWPLHDLGECEVKHGERLHLFNLFGDDFGNANVPSSVATAKAKSQPQALNSIAVLPFVNMSPDQDDEYFSDGMTEELINALAKVKGLRVPARTSAFKFKGKAGDIRKIGAALDVQTVLEGSVRRSGNRLRITAQLIRVADDSHLWSETYDNRGEMNDVFDVQDDITRKIVDALQVTLAGGPSTPLVKPGTENLEAYELYLKGRHHFYRRTADDLKKAVDYFARATQKDPNYALAHAGLADCYMLSSPWTLAPMEAYPKAREAVQKALQIDAKLAEAHTSLAAIHLWHDWDFAAAEQELKRAILLNPNYALAHDGYGLYLSAMGRFDEAIAEMKEALRIDPLSLSFNSNLGYSLLLARQYDRATEQLRKTIDLDPNFALGHNLLGRVYLLKKMYREAIAEFERVKVVPPIFLGYAYALTGRKAEAQRILDDFLKLRHSKRRYVSPWYIAKMYQALGEKEQALDWLDKAYEERDDNLISLNVDPNWDEYRTDPRFKALVKKVGLPEGPVSGKK